MLKTLHTMPTLGPRALIRAPQYIWLLTAVLIILFLALQRANLPIPIPFLLLMFTVAVSGAIAGARSGAIAALLMSGFIVYSWWIGFGPEALTGTPFRVVSGCLAAIALGIFLGMVRDQLVNTYSELQLKRKELALFSEELAQRVMVQTRDLESAHNELQKQQDRLQRLTKRWIDTQEIERHNLARDLHDNVGQILTALRMNLDSGRRAAAPDPQTVKMLEKSTDLVDSAIDSIRQLSFDLRPSLLDDLGLVAALREHTSRLFRDSKIEFELSHEGDDNAISPEIRVTAFRIVQDATSNILKHSNAEHARIQVLVDSAVLDIEVSDDGAGFDVDAERSLAEHFGLPSMRERASLAGGALLIQSASGSGTTVRATLPLDKGQESE